jgi:voltage-gated potassium channel
VYLLIARVLKVGHRRHIAMLLSALLAFMLLGAALFAITQHCPFTTGLYWAITTATTVGYGDVTPKNPSGRFVASAVMLTTIPLVGATFALATAPRPRQEYGGSFRWEATFPTAATASSSACTRACLPSSTSS